jgi:hypothetical protein
LGADPYLPQLTDPPAENAESVERQINELTWSVLDGTASTSDRQRLAELVKSQHSRRRAD